MISSYYITVRETVSIYLCDINDEVVLKLQQNDHSIEKSVDSDYIKKILTYHEVMQSYVMMDEVPILL